jgi:hypothetical protein
VMTAACKPKLPQKLHTRDYGIGLGMETEQGALHGCCSGGLDDIGWMSREGPGPAKLTSNLFQGLGKLFDECSERARGACPHRNQHPGP